MIFTMKLIATQRLHGGRYRPLKSLSCVPQQDRRQQRRSVTAAIAASLLIAGMLPAAAMPRADNLPQADGQRTSWTDLLHIAKTQARHPARPLARPAPPQVLPETATTSKQVITVRQGETLLTALARGGVSRPDAFRAVNALKPIFDPRRLATGQQIKVRFDSPPPASTTPPRNAPKDALRFTGFTFRPEATRDIQVGLTSSGKFTAVASDRELTSRPQYVTGQIDDSLYNAAQAVKMPVSVLAKMIRIFSFDVDFQREVRRGDGFEVLYNQAFDVNGAAVPITEIVFASMTLSKTPRPYYRYTPASGVTDYFDRRGQSVKKTLMRTPVDGARLSSGFGRRKHPILGYTKLHRGADFAAPTGTPIMAAGDGVIVSLGRNGHYGKYIQIRHNSTYSTAYAHMSAYRRGLKRGSRVRQGQTIGYVGSTGRSTGPHLHYEVLVNGKQRNPLGLKLPSGEQLRGKDLANFKLIRDEIDRQRNSLQPKPAIAQQ